MLCGSRSAGALRATPRALLSRTMRDTSRNLRVFDFIHRYARRDEDQTFLEKWRPYIIRVNGTAAVMLELEKRACERALRIATEAIARIEALALKSLSNAFEMATLRHFQPSAPLNRCSCLFIPVERTSCYHNRDRVFGRTLLVRPLLLPCHHPKAIFKAPSC
jgi:hypothetical protein